MDRLDKQMNLFEYGGMADDGMKRDPVSGNEIPPGSMASEVRDDVPAMLSEGEYVVPADVLRYYGVNFFEDLRNKAKQGLTQMDKDGRIGGQPAPMAHSRPMPQPVQAAEGVLTTPDFNAQAEAAKFDPSKYTTVGGSYFGQQEQRPADSITTFKTFVNAETGENRMVRYENGQPIGAVPPTPPFYEFGSAALKKAQQTGEQVQEEREGRGPDERDVVEPGEWAADITSGNAVGWAKEALGLSAAEKVMGNLGIAGKGLGALSQATNVAQVRGLAITAAAQGNQALADQLNGLAKDTVAKSPTLTALDKIGIMSGTGYAKGLSKTGISLKAETVPASQRKGQPKGQPKDVVSDAGLSKAAAMTKEQVQAGVEYAAKGDERDTTWSGGQVAENQAAPSYGSAAEAQAAAATAAENLGVGLATEGRATGGLVGKPKASKPRAAKKGLAAPKK